MLIQANCFTLSCRRAGSVAMAGRRSTPPRVARAMQVSCDRHSTSCAGESGRTRLDYRVASARRAGRRGASISQQTSAGPNPRHFDSRAPHVGARRRSNSGFASDGRLIVEGSCVVEVNPRRSRAVPPPAPRRAPRGSPSKFVSARALLLSSHSRRQADVPRLNRRHRHASSGETCALPQPQRA